MIGCLLLQVYNRCILMRMKINYYNVIRNAVICCHSKLYLKYTIVRNIIIGDLPLCTKLYTPCYFITQALLK